MHPAGLLDAALVLQHSIHQVLVHNHPHSNSKYDYKMYALVYPQVVKCSRPLSQAGFILMVKDLSVQQADIEGEFLCKHIYCEW